MIRKLASKALTNFAIPFTKNALPKLVSNVPSNAINKFERKASWKGAVREGKGFNLFISTEDMDDIIRIVKLLEDLRVLIPGATKAVKRGIKNKRLDFLVLC